MMKRQKRDRLDRARAKGYQAGIAGRSKEGCPYQCIDAGIPAGRLARRDG